MKKQIVDVGGIPRGANELFLSSGPCVIEEQTTMMRTAEMRVREIIRPVNPIVRLQDEVSAVIVHMTRSGFGAVSVVDEKGILAGVFTDGDLRRQLEKHGKATLNLNMADFDYNVPVTIAANALLKDAHQLFKEKKVDNLLVLDGGQPVGMLDIQDMAKLDLI
jgi:CBS domain-containing protein